MYVYFFSCMYVCMYVCICSCICMALYVYQDGNGPRNPGPTRVFTLLGDEDGRLFNPVGLSLGKV